MTTTPAPNAVVTDSPITAVVAWDDASAAVLSGGRQVELPVGVNTASAEQFLRTVRRVESVQIDPNHMVAFASGRSHRRPFERRIPVSMALGLARRGVAATLRDGHG